MTPSKPTEPVTVPPEVNVPITKEPEPKPKPEKPRFQRAKSWAPPPPPLVTSTIVPEEKVQVQPAVVRSKKPIKRQQTKWVRILIAAVFLTVILFLVTLLFLSEAR